MGTETGSGADDRAAFTALMRTTADAVFGFVFRRIGDRALAEDLMQETFLRAWRARDRYRGDGSQLAWVLAIAANVVRDDARARRRRPEVVDVPPRDAPARGLDPAARAEGTEAVVRLAAAVRALRENHREMFLLRERDGLAYAEIARILDCPIGTVMSGLARAREKLLRAVEG